MIYAAIIAWVIATAADLYTTEKALERGGRELNPVVAKMMDLFGSKWWAINGGLSVIAGIALAQIYPVGAYILFALTAIRLFVAYRNTKVNR